MPSSAFSIDSFDEKLFHDFPKYLFSINKALNCASLPFTSLDLLLAFIVRVVYKRLKRFPIKKILQTKTFLISR